MAGTAGLEEEAVDHRQRVQGRAHPAGSVWVNVEAKKNCRVQAQEQAQPHAHDKCPLRRLLPCLADRSHCVTDRASSGVAARWARLWEWLKLQKAKD